MIRRFTTSLLTTLALGSVLNMVYPAQAASLMTRHLPDAVLNGQAQQVGRLPASQSMRIVLVLPLRNQDALESSLRDLYDPTSPSYHQFLTVEQFTSLYGPTQEDYDAVRNFAQSNGLAVAVTSRNRLNLDVTGPVAGIEAALHVNMAVYQHPTENRTFYAADREPTPDLAIPLWHIAGLDNYSIPQPFDLAYTAGSAAGRHYRLLPLAVVLAAATCGRPITADGSDGHRPVARACSNITGTDLTDLNTYYTNAGQTNNVPITLLSTDGTSTSCLASQSCDDTEQTIDMTQALGMAPGLSSLVMYVGSTDSAIFNAMATAIR